jgi:tRNA(Ile)-lysidine synthase
MALLHVTVRSAQALGMRVVALHVHHGLQADADAWSAVVRDACRRWRVGFAMQRLAGAPGRGDSVEDWARRGRRAALHAMAKAAGASLLLLAHHRRDQAETFLLQALRGAGPAGLASMPREAQRDGIVWARPWLAQPKAEIDAYVRRHRLRVVEDPSNRDPQGARSRLRLQVLPALHAAFGSDAAEEALLHAAAQAADARAALDELAAMDLAQVADAEGLRVAAWAALTPARRRTALHAWLRDHGGGVSRSLIERLLAELPARPFASWPAADGGRLHRYRGRLHREVVTTPATAALPWPLAIDRPGVLELPYGRLEVRAVRRGGVVLDLLRTSELRARGPAVQFQRAAGTPPRSLKKQFQAAGVPAWQRDAPLLYAAGRLVFVPGLGIDARAAALAGTPRVTLAWSPAAASSTSCTA